jgi:YesN/AraC family two-component response regulator
MKLHKLLIVDDEIESRDALCDYFPWDELGFEIVERLENGKQALEFIKTNKPDVVFSDIKMPIMNGIELAKALFEMHSETKIVFLSGYAEFEFAKQAIVFGVKDYILKPAKYKELTEVFSRLKNELDQTRFSQSDHEKEAAISKGYDYDEEVINIIKHYIDQNSRDATLIEASMLVNMNSSYLSHFFKLKTGMNFSQYLINVRMEKAARQLMDIKNKIYEVSENVGYKNPKNFTRTFRQHFGVSPTEFRKGIIHNDEH